MIDIEQLLTRQLHDLAAQAQPNPARDRLDIASEPAHRDARHRPLLWVSLAAASVIALSAVALLKRDTTEELVDPSAAAPTTTAPAPIVPPRPVTKAGSEYPLVRATDVDLPKSPLGNLLGAPLDEPLVLDARYVRFWRTSDATLFAFRTPYRLNDQVLDATCDGTITGEGTGYGCMPVLSAQIRPNYGATTDASGNGTWQWSNVPADTDFVQYRSDGVELWQHPLDGLVAFPTTGTDPQGVVAIAYRADGAVLGTVDAATLDAGARAEATLFPDWYQPTTLPTDQAEAAGTAAATAFRRCLDAAGIDLRTSDDNSVIVLADLTNATNPDAQWNTCIKSAQSALEPFLASPGQTNASAADSTAAVNDSHCTAGQQRPIPDLRGLPTAVAMANLALYVDTWHIADHYRSDTPPGLVVDQTPLPGTLVQCGKQAVTLTISSDDETPENPAPTNTGLATIPATNN